MAAVTEALAKAAGVPGVESVASPYSKEGASQISRDGTIAFANVTWKKQSTKVTKTDAKNLVAAAESADGSNVHISLAGQSIESWESSGAGLSEGVGVIAALIILLVVFGGALFASLMPLLTADRRPGHRPRRSSVCSPTPSTWPSVSTDLAVLIGLGVGVDYGLFIISRHRSAVKAGLSYEDAVAQAVDTSGRTVLFAGDHGVHRPARPVRPRRHLPVRAVGLGRYRSGAHHGRRRSPSCLPCSGSWDRRSSPAGNAGR